MIWKARVGRGAAISVIVGCAMSCSHLGRVGVGPVAARPDGGETAYGDELRLREGAGASNGARLSVAEAEARLMVTDRTSALSAGLGPTYLRWLGPAAFTLSLKPALGLQHFGDTLFVTAGVHGGLGLGIVLQGETRRAPGFNIWPAALEDLRDRGRVAVVRRRTLLTLELTGSADARVGGDTLAAALLIGVAWSEEHYEVPAPPLFIGHEWD